MTGYINQLEDHIKDLCGLINKSHFLCNACHDKIKDKVKEIKNEMPSLFKK